MNILGALVRGRPADAPALAAALAALPGVSVAERADGHDGRLVVVIEDFAGCSAAARLAEISRWPQVLVSSLVYEQRTEAEPEDGLQYGDWRGALDALPRPGPAVPAPAPAASA